MSFSFLLKEGKFTYYTVQPEYGTFFSLIFSLRLPSITNDTDQLEKKILQY